MRALGIKNRTGGRVGVFFAPWSALQLHLVKSFANCVLIYVILSIGLKCRIHKMGINLNSWLIMILQFPCRTLKCRFTLKTHKYNVSLSVCPFFSFYLSLRCIKTTSRVGRGHEMKQKRSINCMFIPSLVCFCLN